MANLLNVTPQVNNKTAPVTNAPASVKAEEKGLKDLFQQQLSQNLASAEEKPIEVAVDEDQAAMALASGAVQGAKVAPIELKKTGNSEVPVQEFKAQIPNQLKSTDAKNVVPAAIPAVTMAAIKNGELTAKQGVNQSVNAELATAMAGEDLLNLAGEFDVESYDLKNSETAVALPKEASSKLSTTDFLNLREISQNTMKPNLAAVNPAITDTAKLAPIPATTGVVMGMKPTQKQKATDGKEDLSGAMAGLAPAHSDQQTFGKMMDATVTQTHGQKPVLSQESVMNIGNQVNLLGQARQDGEIKIRLRPDHLGELQMSVRTQGQNVSVQIKAENNEAKKIIEDSLSSLREHLAGQNLSLARIDVVTQPTATPDQSAMQFDSNQNQSSANADRQNTQDGGQQSRREFMRDEQSFGGANAPSMIRPRSVKTDSTRLDLIA